MCAPALASPQVHIYEYRINHPMFGEIGTYTNVVKVIAETVSVASKLDVEVKLLGMVVHRQAAERTEQWQGDRLIAFRGVTDRNGERIEIQGDAKDDGFAITSSKGTFLASSHVRPSNPWSPRLLTSGDLMSTTTGEVFKAQVSQSLKEVTKGDGPAKILREYLIVSDERQLVWFDERGVVVAFRTEEDGVPIDFVLVRQLSFPPEIQAAALP